MCIRDSRPVRFDNWARQILDKAGVIAQKLDQTCAGNRYEDAVKIQSEKITDVTKTPSAKIIQTLKDSNNSYLQFAMHQSELLANDFANRDTRSRMGASSAYPSVADLPEFSDLEKMAAKSHHDQKQIEDDDTVSFHDYLESYFSQ